MRVILCLVAVIAAVNAGIIGDPLSDSAIFSIIQQIGLVEGHSPGHSSVQTIRIIQESAGHHAEAPAEAAAEAPHEEEAPAEAEPEDHAESAAPAPAPGPGHTENDYIIKAVLAARHAAVVKKR